MKTTTQSPSSSATPTTRFDFIGTAVLDVNPWNPNRMTAAMYAKALESIELYGFVDPLTVRDVGNFRFQIIDGEHRFNAGRDLGMTEFPCIIISGLTDTQAKKLTIVMNELHGQADPGRMGDLLTEILSASSMEELLVGLPYDESILAGFIGLPELPSLPELPKPKDPDESKEVWVERLYRMPKSVGLVVDEAIEKARDGDAIETWQGLERIAADYLAT